MPPFPNHWRKRPGDNRQVRPVDPPRRVYLPSNGQICAQLLLCVAVCRAVPSSWHLYGNCLWRHVYHMSLCRTRQRLEFKRITLWRIEKRTLRRGEDDEDKDWSCCSVSCKGWWPSGQSLLSLVLQAARLLLLSLLFLLAKGRITLEDDGLSSSIMAEASEISVYELISIRGKVESCTEEDRSHEKSARRWGWMIDALYADDRQRSSEKPESRAQWKQLIMHLFLIILLYR